MFLKKEINDKHCLNIFRITTSAIYFIIAISILKSSGDSSETAIYRSIAACFFVIGLVVLVPSVIQLFTTKKDKIVAKFSICIALGLLFFIHTYTYNALIVPYPRRFIFISLLYNILILSPIFYSSKKVYRNEKNSRGFTILEVVVVLIILSLLTLYAVNRYNTKYITETTDKNILKDAIRQAQFRAMSDIAGAQWQISFDQNTKTATIKCTSETCSSYSFSPTTYTTKEYTTGFTIVFDNLGTPTVTAGTLPFAIDAFTGYIQ